MNKLLLFMALGLILLSLPAFANSISIEDTSAPYFQPIVKTYEQDANGDGTPDVISEFTINDDGTVEILVRDLIEQGKGKTQKWFAAICGESDIGLLKDEKGNDGNWYSTGSLNYAYLPNYGLPSTWCPNQNNYGYVLSGAGNGDYEYRLHVSNPKTFEVFVGTGTQETALIYSPDKSVIYTTDEGTTFNSEIYLDGQRVNFDLWVEDGAVKKYGANASVYLPEFVLGTGEIKTTINKRVQEDERGLYIFESNKKIRLDYSDVCGTRNYRTHNLSTYNDPLGGTYASYYSNTTYDANCAYVLEENYQSVWDEDFQEYVNVFNSSIVTYSFTTDWFIDPTYFVETVSSNIYDQTVFESTTNVHLEVNDSSLVGYWSFDADSSSTSYDLTHNDNDGTYTGGASAVSCDLGYGDCAEFDGVNDYITIPQSSVFQPQEITVCSWVNFDSFNSGTNNWIVNTWSTTATARSWGLHYLDLGPSNKKFEFIYDGASENIGIFQGTTTPNLNTWYHVCAVHDTTTDYMYVNGASETITYRFGSFQTGMTSDLNKVVVGARAQPTVDQFTDGTIDEVMIFSKALNATEISEIYNNQSSRFKTNGSVTYKSYNIDSDQYNTVNTTFAGQANLSTSFATRTDYWSLSQGYYSNDTEGLIGAWHADGNASDSSVNSNDGTFNGDANANAEGIFNQSFEFDGSGDYVTIGDQSELEGMSELTLAAWVYSDSAPTTAAEGYISKDGASSDRSYYLAQFLSGSDYVHRFLVSDDCSVNDNLNSAVGDFQLNTWQHVVATYDGSQLVMYVDGEYSNSVDTVDATGNICSSTEPVYIGMRSAAFPTTQFDGRLDDVLIYNKSLSPEEVKDLYIKGLAKWVDGNLINATVYNSTHFQSNEASFNIAATNLLTSIWLFSDTDQFYTPYLTGDVSADIYFVNGVVPVTNLTFTIDHPYNTDLLSGSGVEVNVSANKPNAAVTYNYDLYKEFEGYVSINLTYVPNQTISINDTGRYDLTIYGTDNESTTHNDTVSFDFVSAEASEGLTAEEVFGFFQFQFILVWLILAILLIYVLYRRKKE